MEGEQALLEVMGQSPGWGGIPREGHTPKLGGGADATAHSWGEGRKKGQGGGGKRQPGMMPQGEEVIPKGSREKARLVVECDRGEGRRLSGERGWARLTQELSEVPHRRWETPAITLRG